VIYGGEVILDATAGHGLGGGMIQFDDPTVHVATTAHLAGMACGLIMLGIDHWKQRSVAATTESRGP
jgi:membrane associated rhomboid family serine protease